MVVNFASKIALVAPFGLCAKGTSRARVVPLAKALAARGHRVTVFIPPYDCPADSGRRIREDGVDISNVILPALAGNHPGPGHVSLGVRLARSVNHWGPDVVHTFKPKGPSGLAAALMWGRARRGALVVDSDDWEGGGGWNDDPRVGYPAVARRIFAWQESFGLSHADAWTVTSTCLKSRAVGFGADAERVVHLPNAVPGDALAVRVTRRPEPNTVLLYTRFAGVQVADVAEIWSQLRERIPDARLLVVGRGPAAEEVELAGLPGVTCAGWVSPAELPEWFSRSAVAILPWTDTPANRARHSAKLLELMAAGAPIVAVSVGEIPATLGEAGVLVATGDAGAFASAVAGVLGDPARQANMSQAARERVAAEFTWDKLVDRALAAYDLALAHRNHAGRGKPS